jgi:phosphoglycolate phosphatase
MLKKIILFDFDGTLADSLMMLVNFTNRYAGKFGFKGIPLDDLDSMRDLSANDLRKSLGASLLHIILLAPKYKKQLSTSVPGLHLFDGMKNLFRQLKENEHMLGIVTFN